MVWSFYQCSTPAQASPSCDLSGQSVTTSSSPIWIFGCLAPRPCQAISPPSWISLQTDLLPLSWLCSPGFLSQLGPVQS